MISIVVELLLIIKIYGLIKMNYGIRILLVFMKERVF